MIEKLLENWLDSASERSYQSVFVQMLSAQGYTVVHSTRHNVLEFGKDVLAIAPDGTGCAYQLKGNPGGRLGLNQFRSQVLPQIIQLISQPVLFSGFPEDPHRSYLVSNGFFDEEVHRSVDDLNRGNYRSKITLISRGDLLSWCKTYGASLWPSELHDSRLLLELYLSNPKELIPLQKLSLLIEKVLRIKASEPDFSGINEFLRCITSTATLVGIVASNFYEAENHFSVISAWTLFAVTVIASSEKHGYRLEGVALQTVILAETAISDALLKLWFEVMEREHLVEGNPMADTEIYRWRYTLLLGLLSCLAFYDELKDKKVVGESREKLEEWLRRRHEHINLWGEGAVANFVPWLIWMRKNDATLRPDYEIGGLVRALIKLNQSESDAPLAAPYFDFEEVARFQMNLSKAGKASPIGQETFAGSAFTAEALLHLLVRANLKQTCKNLWPEFTKISHRRCRPDNAWEYCTLKIDSGTDETKIYPSTYQWDALKTEASQEIGDMIPSELTARPWLLALWWQIAPYRYNTVSSRAFVNSMMPNWGK